MELIFKYCICGIFLTAISFKAAEYVKFQRLANAGMNMSVTDNELVRQLKRRFTDCITLNKPINNTAAFVEKMTGCSRLNQISGLLMCILYLLLFIGTRKNLLAPGSLFNYGFYATLLYYAAGKIFDSNSLKHLFIMSVTDYLDNTLKNRLICNNADKRRNEILQQNHKPDLPADRPVKNEDFSKEDSELLASVINEFLL